MERQNTAPPTIDIKISNTDIAYQFFEKLGTRSTYPIILKYKKNFGFPSQLHDGTDIPNYIVLKIYD